MKKLLLFAGLFLMVSNMTFASKANLFEFDAEAIENQMVQLDQLEEFIVSNPGTTLDQMVYSGNPLASLITQPEGVTDFNLTNDKALGIPGFLWGCCLNWVGIVVVYLIADDPAETKSAIIGCVVGGLLYGGGGFMSYWLSNRYY